MANINKKGSNIINILDELYGKPARASKAERIENLPSASEIAHGALGIGGMLPGAGNILDFLDASLYASEGDKTGAAIAGAAALPGGQIARIAQMGRKFKKLKAGSATVERIRKVKGIGDEGYETIIVDMIDKKGKKFTQPFYKSTGTSGGKSPLRKGEWMPFQGRQEVEKGANIHATWTNPDWMIKGQRTSIDDFGHSVSDEIAFVPRLRKQGYSELQIDYMSRMGDYQNISQEVKALDKVGYFDNVYDLKESPKLMNKWLREQGHSSPRFDILAPKDSKNPNMNKIFDWVKGG